MTRVRHVVTSVTTWLTLERDLSCCSSLPLLAMDVTRHVNLREAKAQLSRLADAAHQGATVVLTKRGVPWARLVQEGIAIDPYALVPGARFARP